MTARETDLTIVLCARLRGLEMMTYSGYSPTQDYYIGDLVLYMNNLWLSVAGDCKNQIPNPTKPPAPTNWIQITGGGGGGGGMFLQSGPLGMCTAQIDPTGNNRAFGVQMYSSSGSQTVTQMSCYVSQTATSGILQMGIGVPTSATQYQIVAVTIQSTTPLVGGRNTLTLMQPLTFTFLPNTQYVLLLFCTFNASRVAGFASGYGSTVAAPPISFITENLNSGLVFNAINNTSNNSLNQSPWLAAESP